ncbi:MAG: hypothetical protein KGL16_13480 [Acidobacteriota bacterium]|nr:hypothetical protein [Acidobacteriota bacterium]
MPTEPYDDHDGYDDGYDDVLPVRKRPQYLTPLTALLMALILGGVGFYVGIRVEKSSASTTGGAGASAFARAFSGAGGAPGGASSSGSSGSRSSSRGAGNTGGSRSAFRGAGGFAGFGGAAAGTVGTVSSVSGNTLYVQETGGNTVKVELSSATKITKSETVSKHEVYPHDQVVVSGSKSSNGTVHATSVSDSGVSSTGSGAAASSSGTGSAGSSGASALRSLFAGG